LFKETRHAQEEAESTMGGPISSRTRLASIIIPCFNQLTFTRVCISTLMRHASGRWELIVVDNGSSDGTPAYLQGL
jgi:hypothetical protein